MRAPLTYFLWLTFAVTVYSQSDKLVALASFGQDQQKPIQDLNLLLGKRVIAQRFPLCQPGTYTTVLAYAGKEATVLSLKPSNTPHLSAEIMSRLNPAGRAMMEDAQRAATILVRFEDGTQLDSCGPVGPSRLSDYFELAPGQTLQPVAEDSHAPPVASATIEPKAAQPTGEELHPETRTSPVMSDTKAGKLPGQSSAGGKWNYEIVEDKLTGAPYGIFSLDADEQIADGISSGYPQFVIECGGSAKSPKWINSKLLSPVVVGLPQLHNAWGTPQQMVSERADNKIRTHFWNISGDWRTFFVDIHATVELLNSSDARIQFRDASQQAQVAIFSPAGINREMLRTACGIK